MVKMREGCRHMPRPHDHRSGECPYQPDDDRPKSHELSDQPLGSDELYLDGQDENYGGRRIVAEREPSPELAALFDEIEQ